ncbi:MAG TPA: MerR family transcriptional regulator [Actinomycetota bacterium]|nr:MerR family transcriptional regulator [Actinomycetota bacterium]
MAGRPFQSIGEVLAALKPEFADVTVSKIRFLEAEGLITPTRTNSGYRTFYPKDLERLRTILKMQRESFLPLKVIRERLASLDAGTITPEQATAPAPITIVPPVPEPVTASIAEGAKQEPDIDLAEPAANAHFTESDLAGATGLDLTQVHALKDFGVICEHRQNGTVYFDGDDVAVGELARDFLKLGIEPRHLKQLRRFAEQEAEMYTTLVGPGIRNRRADARGQAVETLGELAKLSRRLRQAYVRQRMRAAISGDR